jgi:hypothetical protein
VAKDGIPKIISAGNEVDEPELVEKTKTTKQKMKASTKKPARKAKKISNNIQAETNKSIKSAPKTKSNKINNNKIIFGKNTVQDIEDTYFGSDDLGYNKKTANTLKNVYQYDNSIKPTPYKDLKVGDVVLASHKTKERDGQYYKAGIIVDKNDDFIKLSTFDTDENNINDTEYNELWDALMYRDKKLVIKIGPKTSTEADWFLHKKRTNDFNWKKLKKN